MGVDYSFEVRYGIKVEDIEEELDNNGIDFQQFSEEMVDYDFMTTNDSYTGCEINNTIIGVEVYRGNFYWEKVDNMKKEQEINLDFLKESKYYTFIIDIWNKHELDYYGSVTVW